MIKSGHGQYHLRIVSTMVKRVDDQGRIEPPVGAGEWETLSSFLDYFRDTLEWKTDGLTDDQLRQSLEPSSMTLGGMLKHMALVEKEWFGQFLSGEPYGEPWESADWGADPDWDWNSATEDSGGDLRRLWKESVVQSQRLALAAYENGGLDGEATKQPMEGEVLRLRWIMVHMIEEYARHCGHADLIRESIDGQTGD